MAAVTRTIEYKFNLGNYEHVVITGTVHLTEDDLPEGLAPNAPNLLSYASEVLEDALAADIEKADEISACKDTAASALVNIDVNTKG